jgi:protein-disulfide isomerase
MSRTEWEAVLTLPVDEERDHVQGAASAAVTLVQYGDYECPYCGEAYPIIKDVQARMGKRLCFVFRNFPISTSHPHAEHAAEAAEAADAQGEFWRMHDLLYERQRHLADEDLRAYAEELGLDVERFDKEMAEHVHAARVHDDFMSGVRSGVNGTHQRCPPRRLIRSRGPARCTRAGCRTSIRRHPLTEDTRDSSRQARSTR